MKAKLLPVPHRARPTPALHLPLSSWLLPLVLGLAHAGAGCFLDPTCRDSCDGDKIASCAWSCSGTQKLDVDECHRNYGGTDCAEQTGWSGKPLGCRMVFADNETAADARPACIDVSTPCEPGVDGLSCGGAHRLSCRATANGGYMSAMSRCDDGQECYRTATAGLACVDSPPTACDPAAFPACMSDAAVARCVQGQDGSAKGTTACSPPTACTGEPGAARCE